MFTKSYLFEDSKEKGLYHRGVAYVSESLEEHELHTSAPDSVHVMPTPKCVHRKLTESKYVDLYPESELKWHEYIEPLCKAKQDDGTKRLEVCAPSQATFVRIIETNGVRSKELGVVPLKNVHVKTVDYEQDGIQRQEKHYLKYYVDFDGMKCTYSQDVKYYVSGIFKRAESRLDRFHHVEGDKHTIYLRQRDFVSNIKIPVQDTVVATWQDGKLVYVHHI